MEVVGRAEGGRLRCLQQGPDLLLVMALQAHGQAEASSPLGLASSPLGPPPAG